LRPLVVPLFRLQALLTFSLHTFFLQLLIRGSQARDRAGCLRLWFILQPFPILLLSLQSPFLLVLAAFGFQFSKRTVEPMPANSTAVLTSLQWFSLQPLLLLPFSLQAFFLTLFRLQSFLFFLLPPL